MYNFLLNQYILNILFNQQKHLFNYFIIEDLLIFVHLKF